MYSRYTAAIEEAKTVDRIISTLGQKELDELETNSPFLGKSVSFPFKWNDMSTLKFWEIRTIV